MLTPFRTESFPRLAHQGKLKLRKYLFRNQMHADRILYFLQVEFTHYRNEDN